MNLDIFKRIDECIELFESKRDVYKLIAEEIQDYFDNEVFNQSKYTLNLVYRIKSSDSIREKLVRHSYVSQYSSPEEILHNFQDLIGFRIECKFIDDEKYVYDLLRSIFTQTENGTYFSDPLMPKIKLNLAAPQPQKQKNGFDIYKIDGIFMLGKEDIRFELQIKALVNSFWGEVEHKIIYKNSSYRMVDGFVEDLMQSIKKSLNMIDSQLYVLYKRFKREADINNESSDVTNIERFISKMVSDTFYELMEQQIGFTIDFKGSCEAVVRYILVRNNATEMEDYGRVMMDLLSILNTVREREVRVDTQLELEENIRVYDTFSKNILDTIVRSMNLNYKWHLFFLVLFNLEYGTNSSTLHSFLDYYRREILKAEGLAPLSDVWRDEVEEDILSTISQVFREKQKVELFWEKGIQDIHRSINYIMPMVNDELDRDADWKEIRGGYLMMLRGRLLSL